jgi:ubiquinone/menaquinone biosynthesis C-methylase UbiE
MPRNYLFQFVSRVIKALLACLPDEKLQNLLIDAASTRALKLSPARGLRFLFGLDAALYPLQGRLAVEYDGGIHTKHRHTHYHDFFVQRVGNGERVLDIGCGIGALSFDLAEKSGANVSGIDLDPQNIKIAREKYSHSKIVYHQGDVLTASLDGAFDTIILSNVLEHLPNRSQFLRETVERIRPSRILLRVPVFERDWRVPLKQELGIDHRLDNSHLTEYTLESFAAEMTAAALLVIHQEVRWGEIWAEAVPETSADRDHSKSVEKRHQAGC